MDSDPETSAWNDAATGLDTHRTGVVLRVVIVFVAVIYMAVQLTSRSGGGGIGGFAILLGIGEMLATVFALVGALRFASRLPRHVVTSAGLASLCLIIVLLCEAYAMWITWRVIRFSAAAEHATSMWNMPSIGDLEKQMDALPYIQIVSAVAGLIAVLAILGGIAKVGRALADESLAGRAHGLMFAVVMLAVAYGAIMRWIATGHVSGAMLLVLACLAIFGLIVLFGYIGTLRLASDAMRAGAKPPEARVVDPAER